MMLMLILMMIVTIIVKFHSIPIIQYVITMNVLVVMFVPYNLLIMIFIPYDVEIIISCLSISHESKYYFESMIEIIVMIVFLV